MMQQVNAAPRSFHGARWPLRRTAFAGQSCRGRRFANAATEGSSAAWSPTIHLYLAFRVQPVTDRRP